MANPKPQPDQVLSGIRILDAGTVLAAPGMCGILADFGAEVIKVEQPETGDPVRNFPPLSDGQSLTHKVTNRNKKCITLNLSTQKGQEIFKRLVQYSDAAVLNYRTPTIKKWGLDYHDLQAVNKEIVMLHLTGYGKTGPYADRPGFARAVEAYTGLTYMTGYANKEPMPPGYAIADAMGAAYGAMSLMLALFYRQRTGKGQLVDLALSESMMRVMDHVYISYDQTGEAPKRVGSINPSIAPHDIYPTVDGEWISLPVSTENMFTRLCDALNLQHLTEDPRFRTNLDRVNHRAELDAILRPKLESLSANNILAILNRAGVAASKINSAEDFVHDAHVKERQSLIRVPDPGLGRNVLMQNVVPRLSASPGKVSWPGKALGADNQEIYGDLLGFDQFTIDSLADAGVI